MADTVVKNANKEDYLQKEPFIIPKEEDFNLDKLIEREPFIEPEEETAPEYFIQKLSDTGEDITIEEELQMGEDLENRLTESKEKQIGEELEKMFEDSGTYLPNPEGDIFDRILQLNQEPNVVDLRAYQYQDLAPPLYGEAIETKDITYRQPMELPRESESTYDIGIAAGGNVGIETLKKTTIELQETPPDRSTTVLQRMMKQSGTPARDPRLLAQVAQVLGRDV